MNTAEEVAAIVSKHGFKSPQPYGKEVVDLYTKLVQEEGEPIAMTIILGMLCFSIQFVPDMD